MPQVIDIKTFLEMRERFPVLDVRTPSEYHHAHIPGSINFPLFTDEERVIVGTVYKQKGREDAVLEGLKFTGSKLTGFILSAKELAGGKTLLLYCWRGGMRSNSMAWLLGIAGMNPCTLAGGYKAYRRFVRQSFSKKANIIILGGMTGSGKTGLLYELEKKGEQIIDLEGLARHKGSAFGAIGEQPQPSTGHFENLIFEKWLQFDLSKRIWIEDESQLVGACFIPEELFRQMRLAPVIKLEATTSERITRLLKHYDLGNADELIRSVEKIKRKLGGQNAKDAINAIEEGKLEEAATIILPYYDKSYLFGLAKRDEKNIFPLNIRQLNPDKKIDAVLKLADKINNK